MARGRPEDPPWARPALAVLLVATAVAYLWDLSASGWANAFYAAAAQAGTHSWKAFFFGSSDAANFITVDKPPGSLWVMELSARAFGLNSWSLLVPQALEGVATVAVLYGAVRRVGGAAAGLVAGSVLALTPVAALMFRYDNPDALLVLLLTGAGWAVVRAVEDGRTRWMVLAMTLVGAGFLTKMLQAVVVVPVLAGVYLCCGPVPWWRRVRQVAAGGVALVATAGWWLAVVALTPAADRPYIGGSQDNSIWNLIFGYNGVGRLTGSEAGSVGGAGAAGSRWGPTGWTRMFLPDFGGQISWLLPTALVALVALLWCTRRAPRADPLRASALLWGGTLVVTGAVFSLAQGIIHPYYTVALAPAIGALTGLGAVALWRRRRSAGPRVFMAAAVAVGAWWAWRLLLRTPDWMPWLRPVVVVAGVLGVAGLVSAPRRRSAGAAVAALVALSLLAAPAAATLDTVRTPHTGAIPSAGPAVPGAGPGGAPFAPGGPGGGARGFGAPGGRPQGAPGGGSGPGGGGSFPGAGPGARGGPGTGPGRGVGPGAGPGRGVGGAPGGGFLSASTPGRDLVRLLDRGAGGYTWVAATVNSNSAAGYQLATGDPVMAIGGFNGTDPAPSLSAFRQDVAQHRVHYFIAGGGAGTEGTTAAAITTWVEGHFQARTVDGTTVYDLAGAPRG